MKKTNSWILGALLALAVVQTRAADFDTNIWFGTIRPPLAPPTGEVVDRIFVGDNFIGLAYADQNLIGAPTTPTQFYSIRHDLGSGTAFLDTIATDVAPHNTPPNIAVVDRFALAHFDYNGLAFSAPDLGFGSTLLNYIREDTVIGPQFGTITGAGANQDRFATTIGGSPIQLDSLTFTATDVGYGANLFYYLRTDGASTRLGTIDPALPGTLMDRLVIALTNFAALVFTSTDVGYGANQFYYIRHDTNNQHYFGTIDPATAVGGVGVPVDRFAIGTVLDDFDALTFTTTDVGYGPNLFYYLRNGPFVPEAATCWVLAFCVPVFGVWQWLAVRRRRATRL